LVVSFIFIQNGRKRFQTFQVLKPGRTKK